MASGVSIYDVANLAGVSLGTVSRVLNGAPSVGEATRQKVQHAIDTLGYRPSTIARSLARGATKTLAMLVPELNNPLFGDLAEGAQDAADDSDHVVLVYGINGDPARERRYISSVLDRNVDALVLVGSILPAAELKPLIGRLPVVQIGRQQDIPGSRIVDVDHELGARTAVQHLLSLGHRRIGMIEGAADNRAVEDRGRGFHAALDAAGVPARERVVVRAPLDEAGGAAAMEQLLDLDARFTAVYVVTDLMALGAMSALERNGVSVPREMSVIGFDDIRISMHLPVPLTTVRQPSRDLGAAAVQLALDGIDGESRILPTELMVRASTAPPI
ncbi:MAG: LacI family DNA-binding transcriptional regulator [Pseudolysinimonas sp.]